MLVSQSMTEGDVALTLHRSPRHRSRFDCGYGSRWCDHNRSHRLMALTDGWQTDTLHLTALDATNGRTPRWTDRRPAGGRTQRDTIAQLGSAQQQVTDTRPGDRVLTQEVADIAAGAMALPSRARSPRNIGGELQEAQAWDDATVVKSGTGTGSCSGRYLSGYADDLIALGDGQVAIEPMVVYSLGSSSVSADAG